MQSPSSASDLLDRASELVETAKRLGADQADAVVAISRSQGVGVRMGKIEDTEASESDSLSLRVFVDGRVASVSANAKTDAPSLAERAIAMAKVSPKDPFAGLADSDRLATVVPDLDLYDDTQVSVSQLGEDALAMESAALEISGITNSGGATASFGSGGMVLVTSHGFSGQYMGSRFSRSVSVVAGEGTAMERDYDYDSRLYFADLRSPEVIGKQAAERTVARLNPRKVATGTYPVIYDPRVARGIAGHIAGAINGASVARGTSFLKDRMDEQILSSNIRIMDDPLKKRGSASRPFDGEGVTGSELAMVEDGVLRHWFLSSTSARQLGLVTNGRGVRAGTGISSGSTNLSLEPGDVSPQDLMRDIGTGFYVTEMIGQGVDMVTGQYSRGASGYWIENGEKTFPVSEITVASNLKDMFLQLQPADDIDRHFGVASPTLLIGPMTIAGN